MPTRSVKIGLSLLSHFFIGIAPVLSRYLQVKSGMNGLVLLTATLLVSAFVVATGVFLQKRREGLNGHKELEEIDVDDEEQNGNKNGESVVENKKKSEDGVNRLMRKRMLCIVGFGIVSIIRDSTYTISCRYTAAYNIQMIAQLGPFMMVLFARCLLGEQISNTLWGCLLVSTIGIQLVVLSQSNIFSQQSDNHLTLSDVLGISLQLIASIFSAIGRVVIQISWDVISSSGLIIVQNVSIGVFFLGFTLLYNAEDWLVWGNLSTWDWTMFLMYLILVWIIGDFLQNTSVRWIGSAEHATYQQLRIVSTLLASYFILDETLESWIGWLGLFILVSSISYFLVHKTKKSSNVVVPVTETATDIERK
eukprot:c11692_g1_i1.p1 GENE.c11692_g1_i1~~c11692_g1_i1.p1  ORF type:complete len:397 (-),score=100.42 c11692_g1_i1:60-1151(-)